MTEESCRAAAGPGPVEARRRRIDVRDLVKSYPNPAGGLTALDGVTLHVDEGEFVSVLGPSGSGKSTLFGVLTGVAAAQGGTALVDGGPPDTRSSHVAWMPQADALLPWRTVERNVALGLEVQGVPAREARLRAHALLPEFGLDGFARAHPYELSGGMRQRAAFARTVAQGREVLLLDEPFGALDALTRTELQLWLMRLWEERRWTVALITHDVREAVLLSDRVYVFGPRPARVVAEVAVDLPRPRRLDDLLSPRGADLERRVIAALSQSSKPASPRLD